MNKLGKPVRNQLWLTNNHRIQLDNRLGKKEHNQFRDQLWNQLYDQLWNQLYPQLWGQLYHGFEGLGE